MDNDPDDRYRALASVVSQLGAKVDDLTQDMDSTKRAVEMVLSTVTDALEAGDADMKDGKKPKKAKPTQRDWFAVTDADTAVVWMTDVTQWLAGPGTGLRFDLAPCWPLHPDVVAELLALSASWKDAYGAPTPGPVQDLLGRSVPTARAHITESLAPCTRPENRVGPAPAHVDPAGTWSIGPTSTLDPLSVAAWWALDRGNPDRPACPTFGLTKNGAFA